MLGEANKQLMSPEQLAERLGVSLHMVREMYYTGTWPHLRLNKRTVRFTESHFEQTLALSEHRPVTMITKTCSNQRAAKLAQLLNQKRAA